MSTEISADRPVDVQRFARVYVKSANELPGHADTYYDPERGYYFKLHLDAVATREATPLIRKARERFDVELVRRVIKDGFYKERIYVDNPSEVPDDKKVHEGPSGGIYYETGVRRVGTQDSADVRDVAVIEWDDMELGDEIVFETPDGEETFAEIIDITEQADEADVIIVDAGDDTYRAMPGQYSVDDSAEKTIGEPHVVWKASADNWVPYQGPRGGEGWRNTQTGEVRYGPKPGTAEAQQQDEGSDEPFEAPEGGYGPGWTGPPEGENDVWPGQAVEVYDDGAYLYGDVEAVGDGRVHVDLDNGDELGVGLDQITARESRDGEAVDTQPDPWEDVQRFEDDELAGELIDIVNTEPGEGFTFKRNLEVDDPFERDVWFVGITSQNMAAGEMDKDAVLDFYHDWLDVLEDEPALHIGGYAFEDGEKVSIDLSVAVEDADEAEALGEAFNQESIANLYVAEREGWDEGLRFTGGEGESPVEGPDDVREALADIDSLAKRLALGKSKVFDHAKIYEVDGRQLTGRQIAYMALHGDLDPTAVDLTPVADVDDAEKGNSALTSGTDGAHSARYSPSDDDDDDEEEDVAKDCDGHHDGPGEYEGYDLDGNEVLCEEAGEVYDINADIESAEPLGECPGCGEDLASLVKAMDYSAADDGGNEWVTFVGPQGGQGWVNLRTGEKRYQKQKPGDSDGGDQYPEGWTDPPDDPRELQLGQTVEIYDTAGEDYYEGEVVGFENGVPSVDSEDLPGDGVTPGEYQTKLTAVEADYDRHELWFDEDNDLTYDDYFGAIEDEIPPDAPEELQQFHVGQDLAVDLPGQDTPVEVPVYGYVDGDSVFPVSEDSLAFHYDDVEAEVGEEEMRDRWGEPGENSPIITGPPASIGDTVLGPADEVDTDEGDEPDDGEAEGSDDKPWGGEQVGEEQWLASHDIDLNTTFNFGPGAGTVSVTGATSMTDDGDLSHVVMEWEGGDTTTVHPNIVPETIDDGPFEGYVQTAKEPGFDPDYYESVDDVTIDDLDAGDRVILTDDTGAKGYYITAETYGSDIGFDPTMGRGEDTLYPHEVEVAAVHERAVDDDSEDAAEPEGSSPSEDEAASAVAEPASADASHGVTDYDLSTYDPEDVEEFRDMSDIGANHGNSVSAMEVAVLPDGSKAVHKDVDHHTVDEGDIYRETAGYEAAKHLDPNVPEHAADLDAGWAVSEVVPGVDVKDATPAMRDAVEMDDFVEMAAVQVLIGNSDLHQNNVRVDEDGELYPFDLDRAAGDINSGWVGNLTSYDNTLDRILGELEKAASSLGLQTGDIFREVVLNRAEEVANEVDDDTFQAIYADVGDVDEDFAEIITDNILEFQEGEVSVP